MYQLLFSADTGERKLFAANVPIRDVPFLTEKLPTYFGYRHYGCDVYDVKVSKKSDVDYGKFHTKKVLLPWLYENVFKYGYGFKTLADFQEWYKDTLEETIKKEQIENTCIDILYDDFLTGKDTMNVWKKIGFYVWESILNFNNTNPTKNHLRQYIKYAFVSHTLDPY